MSAPASKYKVLIILFPGFNTLDVNGPYEILRKSGTSTFFDVSVASETDITTSGEGVRIQVSFYHIDVLPLFNVLG